MYKYIFTDDAIRLQLLQYNPELNNLCREAPLRRYLGKGCWEFPPIADNLVYLKTYLPAPELDQVEPCDIVQLSYVWARVISPRIREQLRKSLGYYKVFWEKTPWGMQKQKEWVSCVSKRGYLLAGLLDEISERWPGIKIKRLSYRPKTTEPALHGITLRPYQERALASVLSRWRGIVQSPPGSGKTVIAAAIVSSLARPKVLFIVHTKPLLNQTYETFSELLPHLDIGRVGDGREEYGDVVIATVQTLSRWDREKLKELEKLFKVVIVDEAHHAHADTYRTALATLEVPIRIGLTATPHKLWTKEEYMKVTGILGPIIEKISYKELAELGYVAWPQVWAVRCPCLVTGDWHYVYRKGIMENETRNRVVSVLARKLSKVGTVMIQVSKVEHGQNILSYLPEAELVTGKTKQEVQARIKESLQEKKIRIVIVTTVWKEGVDVPSLDAVIFAAGGKSEISTIQAAGRVLRPSKDKQPVIVDFIDTGNDYLEDHSEQRLAIYEALEWPVKRMEFKEVVDEQEEKEEA